jgi:diguanylate cyclase (GGDEF)-like protein
VERRRISVTGWALWRLPPLLRAYVISVITIAVAATGLELAQTTWRAHDVVLFGLLMGFGALAVEMSRQTKTRAGLDKDVHGIWLMPVALLLPVSYALLAPVVTYLLLQWRTRRTVPHRRVFSAAASGLSLAAVSMSAHVLRIWLSWPGTGARAWLWLLAATGCALLWSVSNKALIMTAVVLSDRTASIRKGLLSREPLFTDACEIGAGLLLAAAVGGVGTAVLVPALPLVVLLQRSLRYAQLQSESRMDAKTGLLNAAGWRAEAEVHLARAQRGGAPLALAIADLDHFKAVNDTYGHLTGDAVLAEAAARLRSGLRPGDLIGRFGGEEFTLLLPGTAADSAWLVADRLRQHLAAQPMPAGDGASLHVTVSIGVAAVAAGQYGLTDLLAAADAALYRAKADGRNTVALSSSAPA